MSHSPRDVGQRVQTSGVQKAVKRLKTLCQEEAAFDQPLVYTLTAANKKKLYTGEDIGEFPANIAEFYWVYCNPAEDKFYGICRLNCNLYAYFRLVDYSCALDEGSSKLILSSSREQLIQYAMSKHAYKKYLKKTVPQP